MNLSTAPQNLNNRYQSALQDDGLPAFNQTGALGIFQLKRIWQKSRLSCAQKLDKSIAEKEWLLDVMVYDELGLGLEPHGSSPNRALSPRIVQYVNMRPLPGGQSSI